jgi:hypothetical protein
MKRAEDAANQFLVVAVLIQLKQRRFQVYENLARFFAEALLKLVNIVQVRQNTYPT